MAAPGHGVSQPRPPSHGPIAKRAPYKTPAPLVVSNPKGELSTSRGDSYEGEGSIAFRRLCRKHAW